MKQKVVAPVGARYRCGFPGCSKRYVSTDGVRKHARKMHNDWLRQVDVHSVLRDKSFESKPSTYCVMECGEGGEQMESPGFFDPVPRVDVGAPAAAMPHSVAEELVRNGGLGLGFGNAAAMFAPPEALMVSLDAMRCGLPIDGFPGLPRSLSLPQAMQMHALLKENMSHPLAREHWANIAALLANPPIIEREAAAAPAPECFSPSVPCMMPTYDTPNDTGKRGGEVSPFQLGGNSNPQSEPSSPGRPDMPEPPMITGDAPKELMTMTDAHLSAMHAKAPIGGRVAHLGGLSSPVKLECRQEPSAPASVGGESIDSDAPLDGEPAEFLDMGEADCDAFLKTLLSV